MGWFYEFITVIAFSRRTQWSLVLGVVGYFAFIIIGKHQMANFELHGTMAPFAEVIRDNILSRYDKAAIGCLITSLGIAIKFYRKDRKRFLRSF